ncbi:hypothetical protein BC834DRAFT_852344 [Gloeopeniophorella convolvens]|nr:hypothetical protein BC834DRAFT_852344 [Gloeopeniophorella convolvens]
MYAEKAEQDASRDALIFNCKQRAHQNTLENTPTIILTTLISAVQYPKYAAVACGLWNLGRVLYTLGYATGEPKKRSRGNIPSYLAALGLVGLSGKTVYDLFKAGV